MFIRPLLEEPLKIRLRELIQHSESSFDVAVVERVAPVAGPPLRAALLEFLAQISKTLDVDRTHGVARRGSRCCKRYLDRDCSACSGIIRIFLIDNPNQRHL